MMMAQRQAGTLVKHEPTLNWPNWPILLLYRSHWLIEVPMWLEAVEVVPELVAVLISCWTVWS